jgi:hypothetical protein
MVTAGHGKGVSVCEMLVADQTKDTMKRCLQLFKSFVDIQKTETFVIAKDFTEWIVIEEIFHYRVCVWFYTGDYRALADRGHVLLLLCPQILLCKLHAIKAIHLKLEEAKNGIKPHD